MKLRAVDAGAGDVVPGAPCLDKLGAMHGIRSNSTGRSAEIKNGCWDQWSKCMFSRRTRQQTHSSQRS